MFNTKTLPFLLLAAFFLSGCVPFLNQSPVSAPSPTPVAATTLSSPYQTYSSELVATQTSKRRVLFFHAAWCPTCQAADKDLTARLSELPNDVVIFKVNYDTEAELKKKYGVTYQHTFVILDGQGNVVTKWNGGEVDELLAKLHL